MAAPLEMPAECHLHRRGWAYRQGQPQTCLGQAPSLASHMPSCRQQLSGGLQAGSAVSALVNRQPLNILQTTLPRNSGCIRVWRLRCPDSMAWHTKHHADQASSSIACCQAAQQGGMLTLVPRHMDVDSCQGGQLQPVIFPFVRISADEQESLSHAQWRLCNRQACTCDWEAWHALCRACGHVMSQSKGRTCVCLSFLHQ